jgi:predicted ATP-dependent endonuclease of OLD family
MHIKEIELFGFRRFTHLKITDLPPTAKLIILAGPNGNGKSSLFDAFNSHHHDRLSGFGAFYIRSAYRNEPDFRSQELPHTLAAIDERRIDRLIDNDASVAKNYRRIASLAVKELYGDTNDSKTFGKFRADTRDVVNTPLKRLFPELSLTHLGRPLEGGTFSFTKGASTNFQYKNLSGGEKAVFDILLDITVNKQDFDNTIYAIDEPESHLNPRLHGELLRVFYDIIPENCQLWLATHAIGMLRAATRFIRFHQTLTINPAGDPMTRNNLLYLVIGALVVVVAVLGYQLYQDRKEPKGVQLNIGPSGVSIEKK